MFREARDSAIAAGDADAATEAVRGLRDGFDIPAPDAQAQEKSALISAVDALLSFPASNTGDMAARKATMLVMAMAEREVAAGEYDSAAHTIAHAETLSRRAGSFSLMQRVKGAS